MIRIDDSALRRLAKDAIGLAIVLKGKGKKALQTASEETMRHIKDEMPVDTGRARSGWGKWTEEMTPPSSWKYGERSVQNAGQASEGDASWEEGEQGHTMFIEQGTSIRYVPGLNAGHSDQAPAGFIERGELWGQERLNQAVDAFLREVKL